MGLLQESIAAVGRLIRNENDGRKQIIQLSLACSYDRNPAAARLLHQADNTARQLETRASIPLILASQVGPLSGVGVHNLAGRLTDSLQIQTGVGLVATIIASGAALVLANERTQPRRDQARQIRSEAINEVLNS